MRRFWERSTSSRTKSQTVFDKVRENMSWIIRRIHENCGSRETEVIDSFWERKCWEGSRSLHKRKMEQSRRKQKGNGRSYELVWSWIVILAWRIE